MSRTINTLAGLAFWFVLLPWACYRLIWPSYDWHQTLTLVVETPQGEISGSATARITWSEGPQLLRDIVRWQSKVRGSATVVDLGEGKYLFALMDGADLLAPRVFGGMSGLIFRSALGPGLREVARQRFGASMEVPPTFVPRLAAFGDIADPATGTSVDSEDLEATFGPGYTLKSVRLEINGSAVMTSEVVKRLDWLGEYPETPVERLKNKHAPRTFGSSVTNGDFIRR